MIERRGFLKNLALLIAAPAIIRPGLLMPVRPWVPPPTIQHVPVIEPIRKVGRIIGARAHFENGASYLWQPVEKTNEIIVMPGQEMEARFDAVLQVFPRFKREMLELHVVIDGVHYTKVSGLPLIPLNAADVA